MRLGGQVSLLELLALDMLAKATAAREITDPRRGGEDGEHEDGEAGDIEQHDGGERSIEGERRPQQ